MPWLCIQTSGVPSTPPPLFSIQRRTTFPSRPTLPWQHPPKTRVPSTTTSVLSDDTSTAALRPSADTWIARSPTLVEMEYAELDLKEKSVGHVRIRQHVNPLSTALSVPVDAPEWGEVYRDPTLPLMVDIGCGSGRFLLWLAKKSPDSKNFLGLEIRKKLVKRAEFWVEELAFGNIHFMFANATVSFEQLVTTYPGPLMLVSILCPDPYFKNRHHKRRVLQQTLINSISKNLIPGGKVFVQSDVHELAVDMRNRFDALSDIFEHDHAVPCDSEGWLLYNPMGIRTEREIHAEFEGAKVFRRLYCKRKPASLSS